MFSNFEIKRSFDPLAEYKCLPYWNCQKCTFINSRDASVCILCNNPKIGVDEIACEKCTFVNNINNIKCRLCEYEISTDQILPTKYSSKFPFDETKIYTIVIFDHDGISLFIWNKDICATRIDVKKFSTETLLKLDTSTCSTTTNIDKDQKIFAPIDIAMKNCRDHLGVINTKFDELVIGIVENYPTSVEYIEENFCERIDCEYNKVVEIPKKFSQINSDYRRIKYILDRLRDMTN